METTLLNCKCARCRRRVGEVAHRGYYAPQPTAFLCRECAVELYADHVQECDAYWDRPAESSGSALPAVRQLAAMMGPQDQPANRADRAAVAIAPTADTHPEAAKLAAISAGIAAILRS